MESQQADPLASIIFYGLMITIFALYPFWRIYKKAGLHPALSFLLLVPVFGHLITLGVLAFKDWPAIKK